MHLFEGPHYGLYNPSHSPIRAIDTLNLFLFRVICTIGMQPGDEHKGEKIYSPLVASY